MTLSKGSRPLILAALALVAGWPLLAHGYPLGHDWIYELARAAEFRHAVDDGQWPPLWAGNTNGGYGAPTFLYYAPLYSALTSLLGAGLGGIVPGATAALLVLMTVAAATMWHAMRAVVGEASPGARAAPWLAAALYVLHPYLLGDALLRNSSAEFAALAVAPLALHGAFILAQRPSQGALTLAAGLATVILAHNLTALAIAALALALALTVLLGSWNPQDREVVALPRPAPGRGAAGLIALAGGVALGLGMAAWFWVPALAYKPLLAIDRLRTDKLDFHNNFIGLNRLFWSQEFFAAGWLTPLVLAAAAVVAWRTPSGPLRRLLVALLIAAASCLWLTNSASTLAWESLPLLELFQFPWRFVGPMALVTALAAGLALALWGQQRPERQVQLALAAGLALATAAAVPPWAHSTPLPTGAAERLQHVLTPAFLRTGEIAIEFRNEYVIRGADPRAWKRDRPAHDQEPVVRSSAPLQLLRVQGGGAETAVALQVDRAAQVELARYAFEGWEVALNQQPLPWRPSDAGALQVQLPPGRHLLQLAYRPPPLRLAMVALSALAVACWLLLWLWQRQSQAQAQRIDDAKTANPLKNLA